MKPERDPLTPELDALLAAARRPGVADPAAEERALQAFRVARETGAVPASAGAVGQGALRVAARWVVSRVNPRALVWWRPGRDDWRPAGERHRGRGVKALVAGVAAVAALGGVAVAAGKGAIPLPFGGEAEPKPVRSAPTEPGAGEDGERRGEGTPESSVRPTRPSVGDGPSQHPGTARDTAAHCRVYLAAVERRGAAPPGAAMSQLEAAAGGPEAVRAYCERLLAAEMHKTRPNPGHGKPAEKPGKPAGKHAEKPGKPAEKPEKSPEEPGKRDN